MVQTNSSSTSYANVAKQNTTQQHNQKTQNENLPPQQPNQQQQQQQQQVNQQQTSQQKRTRLDNNTPPQRPSAEAPKQKQSLDLESPPRKRNPVLAQTSPPAPSNREGASDAEVGPPDPNISTNLSWLRIKGRFFNISTINVYNVHLGSAGDDKDEFYAQLELEYDCCPKHDIKIVIGYFNTQVGQEEEFGGKIRELSQSRQTSTRLFQSAAAPGAESERVRLPHQWRISGGSAPESDRHPSGENPGEQSLNPSVSDHRINGENLGGSAAECEGSPNQWQNPGELWGKSGEQPLNPRDPIAASVAKNLGGLAPNSGRFRLRRITAPGAKIATGAESDRLTSGEYPGGIAAEFEASDRSISGENSRWFRAESKHVQSKHQLRKSQWKSIEFRPLQAASDRRTCVKILVARVCRPRSSGAQKNSAGHPTM
ncbi:uncharacterized protein LOC129753932 [Uranotaenia lowii]|uniref:uncharacterized protein LOC129753932 n=1 Tax=Uranotaenia lowii TaxID=190385 RepID=UPI002478B4A0|nr:uncharacterized protein LOC129753932 [Uranotaenia lowii]